MELHHFCLNWSNSYSLKIKNLQNITCILLDSNLFLLSLSLSKYLCKRAMEHKGEIVVVVVGVNSYCTDQDKFYLNSSYIVILNDSLTYGYRAVPMTTCTLTQYICC